VIPRNYGFHGILKKIGGTRDTEHWDTKDDSAKYTRERTDLLKRKKGFGIDMPKPF
jgi:hypothetical protein